jgi:hypothetical protein
MKKTLLTIITLLLSISLVSAYGGGSYGVFVFSGIDSTQLEGENTQVYSVELEDLITIEIDCNKNEAVTISYDDRTKVRDFECSGFDTFRLKVEDLDNLEIYVNEDMFTTYYENNYVYTVVIEGVTYYGLSEEIIDLTEDLVVESVANETLNITEDNVTVINTTEVVTNNLVEEELNLTETNFTEMNVSEVVTNEIETQEKGFFGLIIEYLGYIFSFQWLLGDY